MNEEYGFQGHFDEERISWARLIDDHDRIAALCAEITGLVNNNLADPQQASMLLLRLAMLVTDHLGVEDHVIDMAATAIAAGHSSDDVLRMREVLDLLKSDWMSYLAHWSPTMVAQDWAGFGEESRGMLVRLSEQVMQENAILYAGALGRGAITLGAEAVH